MAAPLLENTEVDTRKEMLEANLAANGRDERPLSGMMTFNMEHGYLEAFMRGLKSGFLTAHEYRALCQCETLEDVKLTFGDTEYCTVLQNVAKLTPEVIVQKINEKFLNEFFFLQSQAVGQTATFLDFVTYEELIKNISFVITSIIRGADPSTLLAKCSPLGRSPHLRSVLMFENADSQDGLLELYRTVLIDMPAGPYFEQFFASELASDRAAGGDGGHNISRVYNEVDIDIVSNMIQKLWLEDFYSYCEKLGGTTWEAMKEMLEFEADRRAVSIMINSFGTALNDPGARDSDRKRLFCNFGTLYPESTMFRFSQITDLSQLALALEPYTMFSDLLRASQDPSVGKTFEDLLYEAEVRVCRKAFDGQSHIASYYAFVKLKQQEIRNLTWIIQCIHQRRDQRDFGKWIRIF